MWYYNNGDDIIKLTYKLSHKFKFKLVTFYQMEPLFMYATAEKST